MVLRGGPIRGGRPTDRPTITYSPLVGERFVRSFMAPIPPAAILSLIQAGNPADVVLRMAVHVVNGIRNHSGGDLRARPADPEFYPLLERLRRIQRSGAVAMRVRRIEREEPAVFMIFGHKVDPNIAEDVQAVRQILGLDPTSTEFRVEYSSVAANGKEIAILSRSILEVLVNLSSFIAVPEAHLADRRVGPTGEPELGPSGPVRPLIQISSSREQPTNAFLAVPYRDHWFWIDDRDMLSKRLFSFLFFIFTLVEMGGKETPTVLAIPAGKKNAPGWVAPETHAARARRQHQHCGVPDHGCRTSRNSGNTLRTKRPSKGDAMKTNCRQNPIAAVLAGAKSHARGNGGKRPAAVRSVSLRAAIGLVCLSLLLLTGCASMGPPTVARDRFDYVTAVSESWKRQMLLNLLKVRYADAPVFMDIASVINSYELTGDVSLNGQLAQIGRGDQFASLGVTGRYSDKPTITYQPLAGEKFTRSLMLPLPIPGILFLMQSGYPADLVLRICVDSVNGLQNAYGGPGRPQAGDPKFRELITAIREGQAAGGMGLRMKSATNRQAMVMFLRPSTDVAIAEPVRKIRELLGLNATAREFNVVYGNYPENDTEVAILSRSILQLLIDLASHIDVPAVDLAAGRVSGLQRTPEQERMFPTLLSVRCGPSAPDDAHVSVQYRKQWFWIEDGDKQSKQIFNFMMFMFSLTDTGTELAAPLVTIPAR